MDIRAIEGALRAPTVCDVFYPSDRSALVAGLRAAAAGARPGWPAPYKALMVPHAALRFSGAVAAAGFAALGERARDVRRVVLLSPAHRVALQGAAVPSAAGFATPIGPVAIDRAGVASVIGSHVARNDLAFDREHGIEVLLPFLRAFLPQAAVVPLVVGAIPHPALGSILRRLWGGPETLIVVSSDLSHYLTDEAAATHDAATLALIDRLEIAPLTSRHACGFRPLAALLDTARALDLRPVRLDRRSSGDVTGDRTKVVGYAAYGFVPAREARLADPLRRELLFCARRAIVHAVAKGRAPNVATETFHMPFQAAAATFVTLEIEGRLRGCIGSYVPVRPLIADVVANAAKAAVGDPRFPPITPDELPRVDVSISVLSTPRLMASASEAAVIASLEPDRDGLVLQGGGRRALFLPSVWRSMPDPRAFVRALKKKAGIPAEAWPADMQALRFGAETIA